jgi:hypothetical protein
MVGNERHLQLSKQKEEELKILKKRYQKTVKYIKSLNLGIKATENRLTMICRKYNTRIGNVHNHYERKLSN